MPYRPSEEDTMSSTAGRFSRASVVGVGLALALAVGLAPTGLDAQSSRGAQRVDAEYTAKIKEYTQDPRIITELVDHLPASDTVPTPLAALGRIPGTPDELSYSHEIYRYLDAVAAASPRVSVWRMGKTEEGRDMLLVAIADEATLRQIDKYKQMARQLSDPRALTETQARALIRSSKPIYWLTGAIHSPETGSPEMLMELTYRLAVQETPFIQAIRDNVITIITPIVEVDGRDKQVDTFYYGKKTGKQAPPLMYWGKYVAHDNNRDAMGQFLALTRNITHTFLDWKPTVLHDLHESVPYLYTSTGTGPYNNWVDPIVTDEWWLLAKTEVMELTKRGVPGVWTYGFYDGWVPNYMFWIANARNAIGRFYETQSYGPRLVPELRTPPSSTSWEWFRANPPLATIKWGPRNNTNLMQSGVLIALEHVAKNRELYQENLYLKNKRAVEKGRNEAPFAWVIPAEQRRRVEAAEVVNTFRRHGVEVHRADAAFTAGSVQVAHGDYVIRADQPYRTLVDMYTAVQNYAPANPRPYDDTGWTLQLMRNVQLHRVTEQGIAAQPMTLLTADARAVGAIQGSGPVLVIDHTTDNTLVTFRFRHAGVAMRAAQEDFELSGRRFRAGAFIIPNADRAVLEPSIAALGLSAWAVPTAPPVPTHDLDVPRIGYVHAWQRTQDEGWVRAAFDTFGVPYHYFADTTLGAGNLRARYDVIVYPHVGGSAQAQVNGIPKTGADPVPYRKSDLTPNLGVLDAADDIRGGMGMEGLIELTRFVQQGGTLIVEGSTAVILPQYGISSGVTIEEPSQLFVRGSILRGVIADKRSPVAYGYDGDHLPVYFSQAPVIQAGAGGIPAEFAAFIGGGPQIPGVGMTITPNATAAQQRLSPWEPEAAPRDARPQVDEAAAFMQMARTFGINVEQARPRVVVSFPANPNDMLLSGVLVGGQHLANRAAVVDVPLGEGHVVMFGIRPFWRWQTHGTFFLAFNAILNWNDLAAGKPAEQTNDTRPQDQP
jgi:hypothetical protein